MLSAGTGGGAATRHTGTEAARFLYAPSTIFVTAHIHKVYITTYYSLSNLSDGMKRRDKKVFG